MKRLLFAGALAALVALTGCGLSSGVKINAEMTLVELENGNEELQAMKQTVADAIQNAPNSTLRASIEMANYDKALDTGIARLAELKQEYEASVPQILEDNSSDDESRLYQLLGEMRNSAIATREGLGFIPDQISRMSEVLGSAKEIDARFEEANDKTTRGWARFQSVAAIAKRDFRDRQDVVNTELATVGKKVEDVQALYQQGKTEYAKIAAQQPANLRAYDEAHTKIVNDANEVLSRMNEQGGRFIALGQGWSKTLIDMRAEYSITPRRQSWDEGQDYPSLHNHDYPARPVPEQLYGYFADLRVDPLATYSEGWFNSGIQVSGAVDQANWDALKIDPKVQWPSGDDTAEYWIEKFEPTYFHKYKLVRGSNVSETDWQEVTPDFYAQHVDHLGMDIEAKAYGAFPEERLTQASPHGMAFVGNERYGRWVSDGSGGRIWQWLAAYAFFSTVFGPTPYYYPYSSWNTWHTGYRGRNPYYGSCGPNGQPCYGTYGTYVGRSTYYSSSTFGRTGGFSRPRGTVRGAGASSRGGGFGGSGK